MKVIFALGNPGKQYRFTRHNFGHLALDFYAKINSLSFAESKKFGAEIAEQDKNLFIKPTSYYNEIGRPIANIINFYKIPLENILVVCDDFTLPFGTVRYRSTGSSGGNNGLKSITDSLGTGDFPRLRLGTDSSLRQQIGDTEFVLGKFTDEEKNSLPAILASITQNLNDFLS